MIIGLYSPKPQSGKTTVAGKLMEEGYSHEKFAGALYSMLYGLLRYLGKNHDEIKSLFEDRKEETIDGLGYSVRHFMQKLGTDFGRDCLDDEVWIRCLEYRLKSQKSENVVIDDMRFPNEFDWIKSQGGATIKINRKGGKKNKHKSEGALDNHDFDYTLENNSSVEDLQNEAVTLARSHAKGDNPTTKA